MDCLNEGSTDRFSIEPRTLAIGISGFSWRLGKPVEGRFHGFFDDTNLRLNWQFSK